MTDAPTLAAWLLERIAEDEAAAEGVNRGLFNSRVALLPPDLYGLVIRHHPARVLARCEADRRIVELHSASMVRQWMNPTDGPAYQEEEWSCGVCGWFETGSACDTLRALASAYAAADGFREEWR